MEEAPEPPACRERAGPSGAQPPSAEPESHGNSGADTIVQPAAQSGPQSEALAEPEPNSQAPADGQPGSGAQPRAR